MAVKRIRCAPSVDYAKRFGHCLNLTVCFQIDISPGFFCGNSAVRQYLSLDCHGICLQKLSVQTTCILRNFCNRSIFIFTSHEMSVSTSMWMFSMGFWIQKSLGIHSEVTDLTRVVQSFNSWRACAFVLALASVRLVVVEPCTKFCKPPVFFTTAATFTVKFVYWRKFLPTGKLHYLN